MPLEPETMPILPDSLQREGCNLSLNQQACHEQLGHPKQSPVLKPALPYNDLVRSQPEEGIFSSAPQYFENGSKVPQQVCALQPNIVTAQDTTTKVCQTYLLEKQDPDQQPGHRPSRAGSNDQPTLHMALGMEQSPEPRSMSVQHCSLSDEDAKTLSAGFKEVPAGNVIKKHCSAPSKSAETEGMVPASLHEWYAERFNAEKQALAQPASRQPARSKIVSRRQRQKLTRKAKQLHDVQMKRISTRAAGKKRIKKPDESSKAKVAEKRHMRERLPGWLTDKTADTVSLQVHSVWPILILCWTFKNTLTAYLPESAY